MSVKLKVKGDFHRMDNFLKRLAGNEQYRAIDAIAQQGVDALARATPKDTGDTAASWTYNIKIKNDNVKIAFINFNLTETGTPIVILLEYGHVVWNKNIDTDDRSHVFTDITSRGYVKGRHFIQPAIEPILDKIADSVWQEIQKF